MGSEMCIRDRLQAWDGLGLDVDRIWFSSAAPKQSPQLGLLRTLANPIPGYGRAKPGYRILPNQGTKPPYPGFALPNQGTKTAVPWFCPPKPGYENLCTLVLPSQTRVRKPLYPGFFFVLPWIRNQGTLSRRFYPGLGLQIQGMSH